MLLFLLVLMIIVCTDFATDHIYVFYEVVPFVVAVFFEGRVIIRIGGFIWRCTGQYTG